MQWVDLRAGLDDPQAMGNLIWGLTGKRPVEPTYRRPARVALVLSSIAVVGVAILAVVLWPHNGSKNSASDRDTKLKQQAEDLWQNREFDQSEQIWKGLAKNKGPLQNEALQQVVQIEQKRGDERRRFDEGEDLLNNKQDYASAQLAFQDVIQMNLWHADDATREMDVAKAAGLSATVDHKAAARDHFDQGVKFFQAQDFDKARKEFRAVLDLDVAGSTLKSEAKDYLYKMELRANAYAVADGGPSKLCDPFRSLQTAYPFNAKSTRDITLDEFNGIFQPVTGALSQFISDHKNMLTLHRATYVSALGSSTPGPIFLRTLNALYAIQQAVYPNNAKDPRFEYSVTAYPVGVFRAEKLVFDGQVWTIYGTSSATRKFLWPGSTVQGASLSLNFGEIGGSGLEVVRTQGLWAVSRFFSGYRWQQFENGYTIQGPVIGPDGQPLVSSNGKPLEVRFDVDFNGIPFFQAGYLSDFACPAKMSQ